MEISAYLQHFVSTISCYTGDDPLEQWDEFVNFLEQRLPTDEQAGMSLVFDKLVQQFLNVERYANDSRFINYCIKCASFYPDPISVYSHVFNKGVGTQTAAFYVSWAQQLEQNGLNQRADAVYQKALENGAQPADAVLHEYRQFQTRTRSQTLGSGVPAPLQNSDLQNRIPSIPATQNKAAVNVVSKPPSGKASIMVSRSDTVIIRSAQPSDLQAVSQFDKEALVCEGSELSFEEVRAAKYFKKKQEDLNKQMMMDVPGMKAKFRGCMLGPNFSQPPSHTVCSVETASLNPPPSDRPSAAPPLPPLPHLRCSDTNAASSAASHRLSSAQSDAVTAEHLSDGTQHPHYSTTEEEEEKSPSPHQNVSQPLETEDGLDVSQSVTANVSHVTPNTSLGYVQATPSRVLPSPTVNTREALGVIMDMFQAPTFLDETFSNTTRLHAAQRDEFDAGKGNVSEVTKPPPKASFTIFQDYDKENGSAAPPPVPTKPNPLRNRALSDITTATKSDKSNDTPPELTPDESTVWGTLYNSLHLPNNTSDFAMQACCVSTPCTKEEFFRCDTFQEREMNSNAERGAFVSRPTKTLSPIIEQSPSDENLTQTGVSQLLPSSAQQGTIVGEALVTSSSVTMIQPPPPTVLSFRDQTMTQPPPPTVLSFRDQTMTRSPLPATLSFRDQTMPPPSATLSFRDQTMPPPPATLSFRDQTMPPPSATLSFRDQTMPQPPPSATLSFRDQTMTQPPPPANLSFRDDNMMQPPPSATLSFRDQTMPPPSATLSFRDQTMTQPPPPANLSFRDDNMMQPPPSATLSFRDQTMTKPSPPANLSFKDWAMPPPPNALSFRNENMMQPPPPANLSFRDQTMPPSPANLSFRDENITQSSPPNTLSFRDQPMIQPSPPADLSFRDQPMIQPSPPADLSFRDQPMIQPSPPADLSFRDQPMIQPSPPADLSFRDLPLCSTESSRPGWEVYTSPEPPKAASMNSVEPQSEGLTVHEDSNCDVPMSPECPIRGNWMTIRSPEALVDSDMDAFMSPRASKSPDIPMSPAPPPQAYAEDATMMSPAKTGSLQLVSDPWDSELISGLLSALSPPITSHPSCISWQCRMPNIAPKMNLSMGERSLRVDGVVGGGAFATVYQVTDPVNSERMVVKVQKPANPWEFYIDTQLDARLEPDVRHLYSNVRSAHLFLDGSALLCDLHNYGTLLNAVNIYRTLSEKVMPQPLVMHFTVCMLHMVERLHHAGIVHADIKPDNFLLGERFLENKCFDPESSDHGLALVDFGQSIDMKLFPQCTAFTACCLTSGFQCTEMLSGKPWNYQTDYFGIAGSVHCLLFGTYMQVTNNGGVWKTNGVFRRNPHSELWQHFFHVLLNVNSCPVDLRSLRLQLSSVLHQTYRTKVPTLKSRLVVLLLENHRKQHR